MRLSKALESKLMDTRLRDKLVTEGKISATQVEEYCNNLPDDGENMTVVKEAERKSEALDI